MQEKDEKINLQLEAKLIPDRLWDVIIIGAGPAGAIAAAHLSAGQHRVLLLDRKKFPRRKVCGDGLLPDALRCLDAIGVGEKVRAAGHPVSASVFVSPSLNEVEIPGDYLTIKRGLLDTIVVQKAVESGAVFAHGEVQQLAIEPDGLVSVMIEGIDKEFRARIGIIATGVDLRLLHKLNWSPRKKPSGIALRCYVHSSMALDRLIIAFYRHDPFTVPGYGWIFPMQDHEYNVGFGIFSPDSVLKRTINLKEKFKLFVESFPLARELMQQSDSATDLRSAALRYDYEGAYPFINGPIVAVGETIGTTLPFIGEGIGKAMESGHLAAEAVDRALGSKDLGKLSRYHQQIEFEFKTRYQGYRKAGKWLARPRLNDFIIKQFGNSRYAKKALADVIAETKNPEDIFCLKGILKSFWT